MDTITTVQMNEASAVSPKAKPAVPKKPVKSAAESDVGQRTHVRDMVRKLQEKEKPTINAKPIFLKLGAKASKPAAVAETATAAPSAETAMAAAVAVEKEKEEIGGQASNQTLEDLKAIDEDIEKLRKQIEERDKIISALREAAEAKDKKLDNLMVEYSKLRSDGKLDLDSSPQPNRSTSSSPSSPPLCNGELCWTDSFVNKNYHEPVYAQLLNDHTALQKTYNDLRTKLESKGKEFERLEAETPTIEAGNKMEENAINLIMAEQIRVLKEREAQLIWEAEELREQNDLMEFRILELEECRKEFLEKDMNEGKHRAEKIVWRERDFEEISDSGVMSLPTSEDLTSDSELGDAIRNYSPLGAATNLNLLTPESSSSEPGLTDLKGKKSLKSAECLQESGIFVDSEPSSECAISTGKQSRGCQTESVLDKTLLDIIDSSCNLFLSKNPGYLDPRSDDLSTEISKLSVIQKRIQQKTKSPLQKGPHTVFACPHSNSVLFYEERLSQLEDKLKIYESSGDTKDILLARRLEKEVELAHRVKELTDKVTSLEANNRKLEEEKCEFEEAENDTRFQCQRLEIRLQELINKNTELELELERQRVIMSEERRREKKKGNLEGLISKYEQRNFELEEKEIEARHRLNMMEAAMPAIVAWNLYKMRQEPEFVNNSPIAVSTNTESLLSENQLQVSDTSMIQRLEEIMDDQKKLRKDYERVEESAADREKALRKKIEELEAKSAKDREVLEEMTNALKVMKAEEKVEQDNGTFGSMRPEEVDLFEELRQMVANEIELRAEIERLEKKEQAYMQSLEKADEIWAGMEADYKRRLSEAEESNNDLLSRISQLEATQARLQQFLAEQTKLEKPQEAKVESKIEELILENGKLTAEITRNLDKKFEEHRRFLETENASLKQELQKMKSDYLKEEKKYLLLQRQLEVANEELERERQTVKQLRRKLQESHKISSPVEDKLQKQISELTLELNRKSKELSNLEVTVAELREEVETLEGKVTELVDNMQSTTIQQEDATEKSSLRDQASQWELALEKEICHVSISAKSPFRDNQEDSISDVLSTSTSEITVMKEIEPPSVEVLIPSQYRPRWVEFAVPFGYRQEVIMYPSLHQRAREILLKIAQLTLERITVVQSTRREEDLQREDEIFQLSLKNTELLQTLEKMEEESRIKDRELEELQKLALEIRQELFWIRYKSEGNVADNRRAAEGEDSPYRASSFDEGTSQESSHNEPRRTPSIDVLKIINPIVVKTSEDTPPSQSSLQIALDNLQSKCRSKNMIVKPLLDDLNQKGDHGDFEEAGKLAVEYSEEGLGKNQPEGRGESKPMRVHESMLSISEFYPRKPRKTSSAPYPTILFSNSSRNILQKSHCVDPEFSFVAPITTIRKVGIDGIFLEWDVSGQPDNVTGFEIKVNGLLTHRVRSSTRNKALLHPLNLREKISIQVFALSDNNRSIKCSEATFPDDQIS